MDFTVYYCGEPLYKRGTKGEVRVWAMELGHSIDGLTGATRVVSGILDGTQTRSGWNVAVAKNTGKKNATTSLTQASGEIVNEYAIKESRGYFRDVEDIDNVLFTKPMLATKWEDRKSKVDLSKGVYAQPKLDGIRDISRMDGNWSRTGQPITSVPHIIQALEPLFLEDASLELDGELYNHVLKNDFNTITSIVRKEKPDAVELAKAREMVQYHVYDIPSHPGSFKERTEFLKKLLDALDNPMIQYVPTEFVSDKETLDSLYAKWLQEGYEGQMVRLNAVYEKGKRSNTLMKRKDFETAEFPVIAVEVGDGNWAGCVKRFIVQLPDNTSGEATPRGTQEQMRALLESGKVPDWATVRYFGYTPAGKLRFGIVTDYGYGIRKD